MSILRKLSVKSASAVGGLLLLLPAALPAQETVQLQAADEQPLVGTLTRAEGDPVGGVLLLHMHHRSRLAFEPLSPRLVEAGLHVLALDMRGHGDSRKNASGEVVDVSREAAADSASNPFLKMPADAVAGLKRLVAAGAPADRLAVVGAGLGCSVALRCAREHPDRVAALVLMTPGLEQLGFNGKEDARGLEGQPVLVLCAREDAHRGARSLVEILGDRVDLELYDIKGAAGTWMLPRVPGIEARITRWLADHLAAAATLQVPREHRVFLDGEVGDLEAPQAHILDLELGRDRTARIRLTHDGGRLVVGFDVGERCMRLNAGIIYLCHASRPPELPDGTCFRVAYAPGRDAEPVVSRGESGRWKEVEPSGVTAESRTRHSDRWSAELALDLERFAGGKNALHLAFEVRGATAGDRTRHPQVKDLEHAPGSWLPALLEKGS